MKNFTLVEFRLRRHPSTCLKNMETLPKNRAVLHGN